MKNLLKSLGAAVVAVGLLVLAGHNAIDAQTGGGFPSRPKFQSVGIGLAASPTNGSLQTTGTIAAGGSITTAINANALNITATNNSTGTNVFAQETACNTTNCMYLTMLGSNNTTNDLTNGPGGVYAFTGTDGTQPVCFATNFNCRLEIDGSGNILQTAGTGTVPWVQQTGGTIGTRTCGVRIGTQTVTSTTLTADTQLSVTVPAAGTYLLDLFVEFFGVTTGTQGYKFNFGGTSPGGTETGGYGENGFINGAGQAVGEVSALSTVTSFGTIDTGLPNDWMKINGVYSTLRTGTFFLQFAENSASANGVSNINGSYLCLTRIG